MRRAFLMIFLLLFFVAGLIYYVCRPLPLPTTPFEFSLKPGSSLKSLARELQQARLLRQDWTFVWTGRLLGFATQLKAGNYSLEHPVSMLKLLEILGKGDLGQSQISVIEGWTFKQLRAAIDANPDIVHDTLNLKEAEILKRIDAQENHAEGLFFPDTYYYAAGSSDLVIYKRAYQTMQKRLHEAWFARSSGLPLQNKYQALILASIVEKETAAPEDRALIAGVFVNRLRMGMPLQTDPAVIYGLGDRFDGILHKRDLLKDTAYNTYTRGGLTPTPIALPGMAALQAALHPEKTSALYFVARGDGSSQFSSDLNAHNRAVNKYQK